MSKGTQDKTEVIKISEAERGDVPDTLSSSSELTGPAHYNVGTYGLRHSQTYTLGGFAVERFTSGPNGNTVQQKKSDGR